MPRNIAGGILCILKAGRQVSGFAVRLNRTTNCRHPCEPKSDAGQILSALVRQ